MNRKKTIWMCSGQGAQYFQMGRDLYDQNATFRREVNAFSEEAAPLLGDSLTDILYRRGATKADTFDKTIQTHFAICMIQYAMARTLLAEGFRPDYLLGYSLGEVSASLIAGVVTLPECLLMLRQHASLVEAHSPPGGMLAVLASPERIRPAVERVDRAWIAAHNFNEHSVVTGDRTSIESLLTEFRRLQITVMKLPVQRAFHSPLMDAIEEPFKESVRLISPRTPQYEIMSAYHGQAPSLSVIDKVWDATRNSICFLDTVRELESREPRGFIYLDLGPSGTLSTFVKYNLDASTESEIYSTLTPFGGAARELSRYRAAAQR